MIKTTDPSTPELIPDQQLAATIVQELVTKGFVAEAKRIVFAAKLATGQMKAEDWRTLIAASLQVQGESKEGGA